MEGLAALDAAEVNPALKCGHVAAELTGVGAAGAGGDGGGGLGQGRRRVQRVPDDGNCIPRAFLVASGQGAGDDAVGDLRERVLSAIASDRGRYEPLVWQPPPESGPAPPGCPEYTEDGGVEGIFDRHLLRLRGSGIFLEEPELQCLADLDGRSLVVDAVVVASGDTTRKVFYPKEAAVLPAVNVAASAAADPADPAGNNAQSTAGGTSTASGGGSASSTSTSTISSAGGGISVPTFVHLVMWVCSLNASHCEAVVSAEPVGAAADAPATAPDEGGGTAQLAAGGGTTSAKDAVPPPSTREQPTSRVMPAPMHHAAAPVAAASAPAAAFMPPAAAAAATSDFTLQPGGS